MSRLRYNRQVAVEHLCRQCESLRHFIDRPDVMPSTDLGVQKGVRAVYRMRKLPEPEQLMRKTRHLAPYRSAASWYFWRAADTVLMA